GSLLFTPYLGFQDFAMLVVAGWLVIRAGANEWQIALLVAGYGLLELCLLVQSAPILVAEVLLLASFIYWTPGHGSADNARLTSHVPIETVANAPLTSEGRN